MKQNQFRMVLSDKKITHPVVDVMGRGEDDVGA
jgi:hypothetical protein